MESIKLIYLYVAFTLLNVAIFMSYIIVPKLSEHKQQEQTQNFLR